jgi:hypothetical protein
MLLLPSSLAAQPEVVAAVQVHGNTLTPTEDIIRIAGVKVGEPFSEKLMADAEARLEAALELDAVDVLKRYASLTDLTQILIVIHIDEGPVRIDLPDIDVPGSVAKGPPVAVKRSRLNVMFVPILAGEDGYGFTYGVQLAVAGHRSPRRRLVLPLSWGGDKRAAAEFQQEFASTFAPRVRSGAMIQRRTHPFFDLPGDRKRVWGRADWRLRREVHAGTELGWESTRLAGEKHEVPTVGGDVVLDTRIDPVLPHNAVLVRAAVERLRFDRSRTAIRTEMDANAYVGVPRGAIVAVRVLRKDASRPLPAYYKAILGGTSNLRGFRAGHAVGDTLVAATAELRIPATSPIRTARFGYSAFVDVAAAYDRGQRLRDQTLNRGIGAGVWATAPLFHFNLAVARGLGSGTRAHVSAGLTF